MRDFLLDDSDRAFRGEVRDFLARELTPRAAAIEDDDDWEATKAVVHALGQAGYLTLMFRDLYRGTLATPGLTHATILSEEAAFVNYAFETTIALRNRSRTAGESSCASLIRRPAPGSWNRN